jgi:hypothetical protein
VHGSPGVVFPGKMRRKTAGWVATVTASTLDDEPVLSAWSWFLPSFSRSVNSLRHFGQIFRSEFTFGGITHRELVELHRWSVFGDDADDHAAPSLQHFQPSEVFHVLSAIRSVLVTVVFDRYLDLLPAHIQIGFSPTEFSAEGDLVCGLGNPALISSSRNQVSFGAAHLDLPDPTPLEPA